MSTAPASRHPAQNSRTMSNQVHGGLEAVPGDGGWGRSGNRSSVHSRAHTALHTPEAEVTVCGNASVSGVPRENALMWGGDNNLIRGGMHKTKQVAFFLIKDTLLVGHIWLHSVTLLLYSLHVQFVRSKVM